MTSHACTGGCHCGNISLAVEISGDPSSYAARTCDCDFCMKAGARWLSDPDGRLRITVRDRAMLDKYRHGSRSADFLICGRCGVLTAVIHEAEGLRHAAVNVNALDDATVFGTAQPVSPKTLGAAEKIERWNEIWFADVSLTT